MTRNQEPAPLRLAFSQPLRLLIGLLASLLVCLVISNPVLAGAIQTNTPTASPSERSTARIDFFKQYFENPNEQQQVLWVNGDLRQQAETILDHRFAGLRVRYWGQNHRTLWVLDEIGKELPITIAVVVEKQRIIDLNILEYRESRGGEVRYPFFTQQFKDAQLSDNKHYRKKHQLNQGIDGITGATLSVAAVRKAAILALVFHQHTPFSNNTATDKNAITIDE